MAIQRETVRLAVLNSSGGADVTNTVATGSFISSPILMPIGKKWSLTAYISSLAYTGDAPEYTVYASNVLTSGSESPLENAVAVDIENVEMIYKSDFPGQYMVIVYTPNGTSAGTKFFELYVEQ